jgi:hypothetical protein
MSESEYARCLHESGKCNWRCAYCAEDKADADVKRCDIMREALVSITCCNDIFEAAAVANKTLIDEAQQEPQ